MQNKNFRYIDDWAVIRLADSFVKINKSGTGNGEASLYLGSKNDPDIFRFFGSENFDAHCLLLRDELLEYMDLVKCEYTIHRYNYRNEVNIQTWERNVQEISALRDELSFDLTRKRQFDKTGRVYAQELTYNRTKKLSLESDSKAYVYDLIRRIAIPEISYLMLTKIEDDALYDFHVKLYYDPNFD